MRSASRERALAEVEIARVRRALAEVRLTGRDRAAWLTRLGTALARRFDLTPDRRALAEAIRSFRDALILLPEPGKGWSQGIRRRFAMPGPRQRVLLSLGAALYQWFQLTRERSALEEAVDCQREFVRSMPHTLLAWHMKIVEYTRLGRLLLNLTRETGERDTLEEAISCYRHALQLTPSPSAKGVDRFLHRTLQGYLQHYGLPHARSDLLSSLGGALLRLYTSAGADRALDEAIAALREAAQISPESDVALASWQNLSVALVYAHARTRDPADLREAVAALREVLRRTPKDGPERAEILSNLADLLDHVHRLTGDADVLMEVVIAWREAADCTSKNHPARSARLNSLGNALIDWFKLTGERDALEEAVCSLREAVRRTPKGRSGRPVFLGNLGVALSERYFLTGEGGDRNEAIASLREAIRATPGHQPERPGWLFSHGTILRVWHRRSGNRRALGDAIAQLREACRLTPDGDPNRTGRLGGLTDALWDMYLLTGDEKARSGAIASLREAVSATAGQNPDRARWLNNLGGALNEEFHRTRERDTGDEAISCYREAIRCTPRADPLRPIFLGNLGAAVIERSTTTRERETLEEAEGCLREAVSLTSEEHPDRARWLSNLGQALWLRYDATGERPVLEDAIACVREALRLTPAHAEGHSTALSNLGVALVDWFRRTGRREALAEAGESLRAALAATPEEHPDRVTWLNNLSQARWLWFELTGERQALEDAIACAREAIGCMPQNYSDASVLLSNLGAELWDRYRVTGEHETLRESIAVLHQALAGTDRGDIRRPVCLNNLGNALSAWFQATGERIALEEGVTCLKEALLITPGDHAHRLAPLDSLSHVLVRRFEITGEAAPLEEAVDLSREAVRAADALSRGGEAPPTVLAHLQTRLADVLMLRDRDTDWEAAEAALSQALAQQEAELGWQRGERASLDYLRGRENAYRLAVHCRLVLAERTESVGQQGAAQRMRVAAWEACEQGKGRLFAALLAAERTSLAPSADAHALLRRVEDLGGELRRLEREAERPDAPGRRHVTPAERTGRWREALAIYREALAELSASDPELASLTAARPRSLAEVQEVIPAGAVLLELYPLADRIALFAIDRTRLRAADAPLTRSALGDWTRELDQAVQHGDSRGEAAAALDDLTGRLGRSLAPALETLLGVHSVKAADEDVPELLVVPTGALHRWPLHLLPWRGGVLWDAFAISYLPTADTLVYCAGRQPAASQDTLILAPDAGLPGTFAEAALAAADGWRAALGADATVERLREKWDLIALATHVAPDPEGSASRLRLWAGEGPGWVSALEALRGMRGHASAEHGQLGACSAHYEEVREGDHLQGLTRAFLAAGLRSLTTTLWPLDDLAACYLGARFRQLAGRSPQRSKALALRQVALELRDGSWREAGRWLEQQGRSVTDPDASALVLALAAVMRLRGGEPQEFGRLWAASRLPTPPPGEAGYREALRALERYDALEILPPGLLHQWAEPMTPLDWGAPVLVGHPLHYTA